MFNFKSTECNYSNMVTKLNETEKNVIMILKFKEIKFFYLITTTTT